MITRSRVKTIIPFKSFSPNQPPSYFFLDTSSSEISPTFRDMFLSKTSQLDTTTLTLGSPTVVVPTTMPSDPTPDTTYSPHYSPTTEKTINTPSLHHTITHSRVCITKPIQCLNIHTTTESTIPKSLLQTLQDHNWSIVVQDEFRALIDKETFSPIVKLDSIRAFPSLDVYH